VISSGMDQEKIFFYCWSCTSSFNHYGTGSA
jgi:hypothetical protein